MIQTYFGNGKGKTTAAIGAAIRCVGCCKKVLFVQFLKNNDSAEFNLRTTTFFLAILLDAIVKAIVSALAHGQSIILGGLRSYARRHTLDSRQRYCIELGLVGSGSG